MIKKEDLIGFENDWVFVDEDSINIYKFSEDGLGILYTDDEEIDFKWKISQKGFINLTYKGNLFYLKLNSKEDNLYNFAYFKKENEKAIKIKDLFLTRKDLNKVEEVKDFEESNFRQIINEIKSDNIFKILFTLITLFTFIILLVIINFLPIINSMGIAFKILISLGIIIYGLKKIYFISKYLNNKYRDKIKNLLF